MKRPSFDTVRILLTALLFLAAVTLRLLGFGEHLAVLLLEISAFLLIGCRTFLEAAVGLWRRRFLDEVFLMTVASLGAFLIGERLEGVAVLLLYLIGEKLEHLAVRRSRRSIAALARLCPDTACVLRDGAWTEEDAEDVQVGEVLRILPGERVPLDCLVTEGESSLDLSPLTGESVPAAVGVGEECPSGALNLSAPLTATVTKTAECSTAGRILALVEEATDRRAPEETFVRKFARVYTPIVCLLALLLATVPPFFFGWHTFLGGEGEVGWLYRALSFLVVSCPCALVISVPLAFFGGIGGAASVGILFKGGTCFSAAARVKCAAFDKTGTLTDGEFTLEDGDPALLSLAAALEAHSRHPLARSVTRRAESLGITPPEATDVREFPGRGLSGKIGEDEVLVGNARLMAERRIPLPEAREGTVLYVAKGGDCLGTLTFRDTLKPTAKEAMAELDRLGIRQRELLTGDRLSAAREVGLALGLSPIHGELTPEDKYRRIEELSREGVLYAGDGINDAPAMALATFSVAMGKDALGAAVEAADAVIVSGEVAKIPLSLRIARRTLAIAKQNIVFSLTVKAAALAVTALGILPAGVAMAVAMFADVGVCLLAVANAMRALRVPRGRAKTAP